MSNFSADLNNSEGQRSGGRHSSLRDHLRRGPAQKGRTLGGHGTVVLRGARQEGQLLSNSEKVL